MQFSSGSWPLLSENEGAAGELLALVLPGQYTKVCGSVHALHSCQFLPKPRVYKRPVGYIGRRQFLIFCMFALHSSHVMSNPTSQYIQT